MQIQRINSINKKTQPSQIGTTVLKNANSPKVHSTLSQDTVNFTGLNRNLSKTIYYTHKSIKKESTAFPKSNGIVGNLPAEWIQKIPKENRANIIKELYSELKPIINELKMDNFSDYGTSENLNKAFTKAGIIKNSEKIKLEYIDDGFYGYAYRLNGLSDDKYIIKVFKPKDRLNDLHGSAIEPNRAAFWQKYAGKNTQMVPFYFGDIEAGYMINKFIDKNVAEPKKNIRPEVYGLKSFDIDKTAETGHNKINGYQIDYGGIYIEEDEMIRNKKKQSDFKRFLNYPKEKQLANINKADEIVKRHIIDTIDLRPTKDRAAYFEELLKEPTDEIKTKIADKLFILKDEDAIKLFKELAKDASDKVKIKLAGNIQSLPANHRAECFMIIQKDSSDNVKNALISATCYVPKEQRSECCKILAENAAPEIKNKIDEISARVPNKIIYSAESTITTKVIKTTIEKDSGFLADIFKKIKKK